MSLKEIAVQTLQILDAGYIITPGGERLSLQPALSQAIEGTRLYTPEQAAQALSGGSV